MKDNIFCGSADCYPSTSFVPKSVPWNSAALIGHLDRSKIVLPDSVLASHNDTLWDAMCAEYDAENFCNYLKTEGFNLSPEFKAFEYVWRRDEHNHYLGFRHIYSILYGGTGEELVSKIRLRVVDFAPIREMLEDEFMLCLLLAYDEIATTKSYALDYGFYKSLGHGNFLKWIKLVTRDEAYHFNNCMELIGRNHYHRASEIPGLVDKFIEWDLNRNEYQGTFVLDHMTYGEDFLVSCGTIMKQYFKR